MTLVILNWSIYREIKRRSKWLQNVNPDNPRTVQKQREIRMAFLLVIVILVFLVCHTLRFFLSVVELSEVFFGKSYFTFSFVIINF